MNIMGVDQSLTGTGITVFAEGEEHYDLLSSTKTKNTKAPTIDYTHRLVDITNRVAKLVDEYKITHICMEGMSFGSRGQTIFELGGLSHLLRAMYFTKNIDFIIIPPKTLKKFATNNGNADKITMIEEAMRRGANIPFFKTIKRQRVFDDNVVDAYFLAVFMQDYLNGCAKDYEDKIEKSWDCKPRN